MLPKKGPPMPPGRPVIGRVSKGRDRGSSGEWADYSHGGDTDAEVPPASAPADRNSESGLFKRTGVDDDTFVDASSSKGEGPTSPLPPPPPPPTLPPKRPSGPPPSHQPETSPVRDRGGDGPAVNDDDDDYDYLTFATCDMPPSLFKEWGVKEGDHWYEVMKSNEIVLSNGENVPGVDDEWIYCLLCDKKFCSFDALKMHLKSTLHGKRITAFRGDMWTGPKLSPRTPRRRPTEDEIAEKASCELPEYVNADSHGWICTVCCGHHPGAVLPSSALMEMHLTSDQHNAECVALGIDPFRDYDEEAATLVGERNAEVMSENCMVTIRYKDHPLWVYCAACDARMEGVAPLHRHVDSVEHRDGMETAQSRDRRTGWSWGTTAIIDEDGTVIGRRRSSLAKGGGSGGTTVNYRNDADYERDPNWPKCIEDSEFGWECSWCDAQLASSWHVTNHLQGKKHKRAEAYRSYEEDTIPPPPSRDPVFSTRYEETAPKLPVKKPAKPLKPACPPPRRPSHSPPRQTFEQRVMDFEGHPSLVNPPPPPPLPVEVTSSTRSSVNQRHAMSRENNWQDSAVDISAHPSRPAHADHRDDSAYRMPASFSGTPEHHSRQHAPPELYNERPSPTRAYYDSYHHREDSDYAYGSGYELDVRRPESRERRRERYSEAYTPVDPWGSSNEGCPPRSYAARQLEFVTQQCVKIYGAFPPKFITKDCVCETCMVGPGRDLPLDSREGLAWTAEHVYVHLKTRVTVLEMGTCHPVRKVTPRGRVDFTRR
ncbi:hypothetical protein FOZ62_025977 [Perkinsus olseni]|uniref:C2H2-type domain-containing protein n=2 Tax=Perkinsus olseni TaxID=32597 RepID=A0A7J6NPB9_PEROL|nr:hypothetical protein FOZ62_025977 [Perkinsus olseni]